MYMDINRNSGVKVHISHIGITTQAHKYSYNNADTKYNNTGTQM